jgi:Kdo2-lipid IVA lauroyltransferase/acyltransferase
MTDPQIDLSYSFRLNRWSRETAYWHDRDGLHWRDARGEGRLAYTAIRTVQVYKVRYFGSRATYWRCVLHHGHGRRIRLQAAHYAGLRRIEDRSAMYIPFVKQLESRIALANPHAAFTHGRDWLSYYDAALGALFVLAQKIIRLMSLDRAADIAAWSMRRIGPQLKGHRVARANLVAAYPEKSAAEIERILLGMWDNLGRVFVEYAHLDRLWDFDPGRAEAGRIVLDADSLKRFRTACDTEGPALFFGAHLANWELIAWAVGCFKGESALVYRPPKLASVARELATMRARSHVAYIPAGVDALFQIKDALRRHAGIGMLVDEHFSRGVDVMLFGRRCKASPILARFARQFDCRIYGGRMIRLPDGKFAFDITDAIRAPRDAAGKIDVAATTQLITGIIEGWVREHPEQWLWLQRRWR